jgi:basic membrane protein A
MSTKKLASSLVASRRMVVAIAACLALLPVGALNCASASTSNKIAILYDQGGRGDHALNDAVALGVDAIKKKFHLSPLDVREMVTTGTEADRYSRLLFLAHANYSLIVAVGSGFSSVLSQAAVAAPNSQFAIINDESVASLNVSDLAFDGAQGAYLAGVLAGSATKSLKVGFIAPPSDSSWLTAFSQGVASVSKKAQAFAAFTDVAPGAQTKSLYAQGVDVIFSEWSSSSDVADEAAVLSTTAHPLYLIGLSPDQYFLLQKSGQKILLGAVTKRVDLATQDVMSAALQGRTVNDVLNESAGIFGHLYTVPNGGESMALTSLGQKYALNVGNALAALKSGKVKIA